jgi:protein involved in temperature-dependent protein secretion
VLRPEQDERGVWWFDAAEVEELARAGTARQRSAGVRGRENAGASAARVFRLLAEGQGLREIVVATKQTPERVRELYRQWMVGLSEGEQQRHDKAERKRERSEDAADQRAQIALIRAIRS